MTSPALPALPSPDEVLAAPAGSTALAGGLKRARDELLAGQLLTAPTSPAVREGLIAALRRAGWRVLDAAAGRWVVEALPRAGGGPAGGGTGRRSTGLSPLRLDVIREANVSKAYRRVLWTSPGLQLVAMALGPDEALGPEAHPHADQVLLVALGRGEVRLEGKAWAIQGGELVVVPAGTKHDVVAGAQGLRLLTLYAPPLHLDGRVHQTRAEAEADIDDAAFGAASQEAAAECERIAQESGEHAECIPGRYRFAVEVPGGPEGGARCSTCRFAGADAEGAAACYNALYVARTGTGRLPLPAERWCCSLWTVTGGDGEVAGDDSRASHGAGI